MRKFILSTLNIVLIMSLINIEAYAQKTTAFAKEYVDLWERAADYTIEVARAMPEEYYNYRPNEETLTFSEQIAHIITNMFWLNSTFILNETSPIKDASLEDLDKEDLIKNLEEAVRYVSKSAESITDKDVASPIIFAGVIMDKRRIFYLIRDHLTHHRAQSIVYLRLNGIEPPEYRGW